MLKQTKGHYPAPLKALEVIEKGLSKGFEAGIKAESEAFVELVQTDVAKNLINLFFMKNEIDKDPVVSAKVKPTEVTRMGVLGAGLMGAGIVQVAAFRGYNVRLKDRDAAGLGWGLNYCNDLFQKQVSRRSMSAPEADIAMGRISGTTTYEGFELCEIVIEAVFEDVDLKQKIVADIDALGNPDLIFASNTSTIPITKIAEHAKHPENVIGMHFFSPVHKMPLLEIIKTDKTSDRAIATTLKVGRDMGKTCIVVSDGPGFFTSRVVGSYINEAGWVLQEGGSVEAIDQTMEAFGFPVGPMKLTDEVGIDVGVKAAKVLGEAFKHRLDQPTALLVIADEGRKGRKNGKGLYLYGGDTKGVDVTVYDKLPGGRDRKDIDRELIRDRIWLAMLNECAYCLQEGIAATPRDIDIGVIFGLGFPPFRGGICRYADTVGIAKVVATLDRLSQTYGKRLAPAQILVDMAKKNQTFYKG
ncbi:MAG: 3-hydroxyacyl-CoA dehydrogenase NAD-binding domain-containing protein [bacterium]